MTPKPDSAGSPRDSAETLSSLTLKLSLGVYFLAYVWWTSPGFVGVFGNDAQEYMDASAWSVADHRLWTGLRPPLYPMFVKLLGRSADLTVAAQTSICAIAFSCLAYALARRLRTRPAQVLALLVIPGVSFTTQVSAFGFQILTENPSISILVLVLAALISYFETPPRRVGVWLVVLSWAWVLLRYSNATQIVFTSGLAAIAIFFSGRGRAQRAVWLTLGLCTMATLASVPAMRAGYWRLPFHDVVVFRVLGNEDMKEYFMSEGLPEVGVLDDYRQKPPFAFNQKDLESDPRLEQYRAWVNSKGKSTYIRYSLLNPQFSLLEPYRELGSIVGGTELKVFAFNELEARPSDAVTRALTPGARWLILSWIGVAGGLTFWLLRAHQTRARRRLAATFAVVAAGAIAQLWLTWWLDPNEIPRHALSASLALYLCLWGTTIVAIDAGLESFRQDPIGEVGNHSGNRFS